MRMQLLRLFVSNFPKAAFSGKNLLQRTTVPSLTVLVLFLAAHMSALGQINTASLSGNVKDSSGAAVPGASVVVLGTFTGTSRTITANDSGFFNISLLQPSDYKVTVSKAGFKTDTEAITLHVDQLANLDFTLVLGSVQEQVSVTIQFPICKPAPPLLEPSLAKVKWKTCR